MNKEIIVLGDIEMGGGTLTDDFISDKTLANLILKLSVRRQPIDLVLNGDTFDFLKCPYLVESRVIYPRHITEEISLGKLNLIYQAHGLVFKVLKKFVSNKLHELYFIIGNHDYDLVYPKIQKKIRELLGSKNNIHFRVKYQQHEVYIEHGQQYDLLNKMNFRNLFVTYKGKSLLNLPWLTLGMISRFMSMKEEHPFLERINPMPTIFRYHKEAKRKLSWRFIKFILKSIFYNPLRYWGDPTYKLSRNILLELYRRILKMSIDLDNIVTIFKLRKRKKNLAKFKVHVLSHIHKRYVEEKKGWAIIHPDTWRDEYFFDQETKKLTPKTKKYVKINIAEPNPLTWELIEVPIKRSCFDFSSTPITGFRGL